MEEKSTRLFSRSFAQMDCSCRYYYFALSRVLTWATTGLMSWSFPPQSSTHTLYWPINNFHVALQLSSLSWSRQCSVRRGHDGVPCQEPGTENCCVEENQMEQYVEILRCFSFQNFVSSITFFLCCNKRVVCNAVAGLFTNRLRKTCYRITWLDVISSVGGRAT